MRYVLDGLYYLIGLLYLPFLLYRVLVLGKNRTGWAQRFGGVPRRAESQRCIWVHAVSVGEVNATRTLVTKIERSLPDMPIVISTTTDTGFARARQAYPNHLVFRCPLDVSWAVARTIKRLRPAAIVLMELEVWPNMLDVAKRHGVPVMVANGRVTEQRSMRRFGLPIVRTFARWMFSRLACVGAQDEAYADRFRRLGVPADRVHVTGTMKYDTAAVVDSVDGQDDLAAAMSIRIDQALWVCGCTGPGEEAVILDAYRKLTTDRGELQLAIIPRKPERFDEAAAEIDRRGLAYVRRSRRPDKVGEIEVPGPDADALNATMNEPATERPCVFLGDTMGELRKFYALADVVFVGRTMVDLGGSDVLEVAGLARPMLVGPSVYNFAEPVRTLLDGRGIVQTDARVDDPDAAERLADAVEALLTDEQERRRLGQAAREVLLANQGATQRTVELLRSLLTPDA